MTTRTSRRAALRATVAGFATLAAAGLMGGCGGSSGSGSSFGLGEQGPDPVIVDFPIAYVKRPLLLGDEGELLSANVRDAAAFLPGAELYIRDRASPSAQVRVLTAGLFPNDDLGNPARYDVKDLATSFDGRQLLFALRAPEDPDLDEDEQPTWNIWLYDFDLDQLRRVMPSDLVAEDGQDVAPQFLPDGRIAFASTRQRQSKAVLLDEGKPQFSALEEGRNDEAFTLHVMNGDGSDIQQISFNQSHDLDPAILADGRIVYSRWDHIAGIDRFSLYTVRPDGTGQSLLYGVHSHDTGPNGERVDFGDPRALSDGRVLVTMRPAGGQIHLGAIPVAIDTAAYVEHDQPTFDNQGLLGDAQEVLVPGSFTLDDSPSPRGRFGTVSPIYDGTGRLLVTWSPCRLIDPASPPPPAAPTIVPCSDALLAIPDIEPALPLYGVWMFDVAEGTQQPVVIGEEGFAFTDAVVLEPRALPAVILDGVPGIDLDADLVGEGVGVLHVRNVYEFDGESLVDIEVMRDPAQTMAAQRPARFLRIEKAVSIPDEDIVQLDGTAFGASQAQLMREIIGYAPIEPDGSVKVKVPANVAFAISVLDGNGRRISERHQNWLQLRPGEALECNGCHSADSETPHGRPDAEAPSTNSGAPSDGSPFPNTDPALFADSGETMAETWGRLNGVPNPDVDVRFDDVWTDPGVRAKDPSFAYTYADLSTPAPVAAGCVTSWVASCRIVINYVTHVQPIWESPRPVVDASGIVIADHTCTSCHAPLDAMGAAQLPAAQLDLSATISAVEPDHLVSYRELLFPDNQLALIDGALAVVQVQATDDDGNPLFETDGQGNLILDANGDPIPVLVPVELEPPLSTDGALASPRFFDRFESNGTHAGWLTEAERRLISEWVDIGAQYYNDPFAVPQN